MPKFSVTIWVSETRYYEVEAEDADSALDVAKCGEPYHVKNHDLRSEVTEE